MHSNLSDAGCLALRPRAVCTCRLQAVAKQPVAVYWAADEAFQHYAGGVYSSSSCGSSVNHAMVVVGFNRCAAYSCCSHCCGAIPTRSTSALPHMLRQPAVKAGGLGFKLT